MPSPGSGIDWSKIDQDQNDKARDLVHGGQDSFFPNMATAAGKALVQLARKGMNLANIGGAMDSTDPNQFGSESSIKNAETTDKPAYDAPGGRFGQIVADTAGTAPIGGPIEATVGKVLGKTLLARLAASSVSGGAIGAATSDPGERGSNALTGTALGGSLGALQALGSRLLSGVVKKSDPLQLLEGDVARTNAIPGAAKRDLFVPISQGADPNDLPSSVIGGMYRSGLPYIPGVAPQLNRQANQGIDTMMGTMLQSSAPEGNIIPSTAVNDMQLSTAEVKKAYDRIYQNLRQVDNIAIPKDFKSDLAAKIQTADPQIPKSDVTAHVDMVYNDLLHQAENNTNAPKNFGTQFTQSPGGISGQNGGATAMLQPHKGEYILTGLKSDNPGNGEATALMKDITNKADSQGKKITLLAFPDADEDLHRLIEFYEKHGFESTVPGGANMIRNPQPVSSANTGKINAFNLKNTRDNIPTLSERVGQEVPTEQKAGLFDTTKQYIDDMFGKKVQQLFNLNSQKGQDILNAYRVNAPNYENFQALHAAVNNPGALSNSGAFRPGQVAGRANDFTDIQGIDQSFKSVFGKSAVQPTAAARVAGYPIAAAAGVMGHLPGVMALLAGGNALATKSVQKALYGDNALQSAIAQLAKNNPKLAASLGYAGRNAVTSDLGED